MIDKFVIGSGKGRKVIEMVRDKAQRRSAAGALKGFLFPTKEAHDAAMAAGRRRKEHNRQQRVAFA